MSSYLEKEDDEYLYLSKYVHANSDELPEWFVDKDGHWKFREEIILADDSVGYEVEIKYRIRKSDAKVFYDEVTP